MKYCIQCGKEIKNEAKFCPACGKNQIQVTTEAMTVESVLEKGVQLQSNLNEQLKNNQTVQQLTKESKNYFSWLNTQIRGKNKQSIPMFGVVNFLLLIVLNSLAVSRSILSISGHTDETPLSLFIESLLMMGIYYFIFVLVYFFMVNKLFQTKIVFTEAFDALFSPASLTVYISLFAVLLSFMPGEYSYMFVIGLVFLSALLISFSFAESLWHRSDVIGRFGLTLFVLYLSLNIVFFLFKLLGGSKVLNIFIELLS